MSEPFVDPARAYIRVLEDKAAVTSKISLIVRLIGLVAVGLYLCGQVSASAGLFGTITIALDYGQYVAGLRSSTATLDAGGDYKYRTDAISYRLRSILFTMKQMAAVATLTIAMIEKLAA